MDSEHAVKHLSQSHMYCWRTLAVTLELFPALYRTCMFQLALLPPGLAVRARLFLPRFFFFWLFWGPPPPPPRCDGCE